MSRDILHFGHLRCARTLQNYLIQFRLSKNTPTTHNKIKSILGDLNYSPSLLLYFISKSRDVLVLRKRKMETPQKWYHCVCLFETSPMVPITKGFDGLF